ncbi:hypothetical protein [Bifidobacterium sp. SO4]|uniref:hypothetical protein n=1 Tax=Bifidobacterium sp. SO4 TaxID=2809030 RepID=UPI001BDD86AA|nr:hypothetical protein [Bifidobacterium sp. SO4]MBT1171263.1 hypothetical protein [Bifidobacterium sp. SO4]
MGVLEQPYVHADISFARGTTFKWGWHCYRKTTDGATTPMDLSSQTVRLRLYTLDEILLVDKPVSTANSQGLLVAEIEPADFSAESMKGRRRGVWQVIGAQPDGEALFARWSPPAGADGSLLQTMQNLESGEVTLYGWGYWLAH